MPDTSAGAIPAPAAGDVAVAAAELPSLDVTLEPRLPQPETREERRAREKQEEIEATRKQCRYEVLKMGWENKEEVADLLCATCEDMRRFNFSWSCYRTIRAQDFSKGAATAPTALLCQTVPNMKAYYARLECMKKMTQDKSHPTYLTSCVLCQHTNKAEDVYEMRQCWRKFVRNPDGSDSMPHIKAAKICRYIDPALRRKAYQDHLDEQKLLPL
eukprot:EG_transcript_20914